MKEANIIAKFREKLPGHWTAIENSVKSGVPDYMVSRNGEMCWVEFKRLYERDIILRPLQRNWFVKELRHNGRAVVAYWNDGPCILLGYHLLQMEPQLKGGKLYYDIIDHTCAIRGWSAIDNYLFKD